MDHQIPEVTAASMLAAMGLLDVVGTTASGWLTDRFNPRLLLFTYYGLRGLSLIALPHAFAAQHLSLGVFVAFYGLDWIATVPPTVALVTQTFGEESGLVVYGWVFAAHQIGAAVGGGLRGGDPRPPRQLRPGVLHLRAALRHRLARGVRRARTRPTRCRRAPQPEPEPQPALT